jgi:EmrB/QacA subfamily drug resistance transporter
VNCGPMPCKEVDASVAVVSGPRESSKNWVLAATILGSSMEFIDGTVVNVALPNLQSSLGATGAQAQWIVEAYALFISSLLLIGGSLGDRFGVRRMFLCGVVLFTCASIWCGVSPGIEQLLIGRCLQGIGGALLVPNSLALLSAHFQGTARGRAIGIWSGFASIMTALGPVLGGWMVQHRSWRAVFFLNVPIALATAWIVLTRTRNRETRVNGGRLDLPGMLLATIGLSCVTFGLLEWSSHSTLSHLCGAIGLLSLVLFVLVERRTRSPLVPMELFLNRNFAGANLLTLFLYGALSATLFYLPLNLIQAQNYSPTRAGAATLPMVLLMFLLSRWAGGLVERYGTRKPLIIGPLVAAGGFVLFALPGVGGSYWITYFPAVLMLGFGMTVSVAPLTTLVMSSVTQNRVGAASGINNAVSQTAALLAIAVSAPIFFACFRNALPNQMKAAGVSPPVVQQLKEQETLLGAIRTDDPNGRVAIDRAFVDAFRLIALLAATASASAGVTALVSIRNQDSDIHSGAVAGHRHHE